MTTKKIRITTENNYEFIAGLLDNDTSNAIWDALPIESKAETWGDEIYFRVPVNVHEENAKKIVELGDLGYWPPGAAFCIFFGKTPASKGDEIRPASPVNVFGHLMDVDSDIITKLRRVAPRDFIRVEKVNK